MRLFLKLNHLCPQFRILDSRRADAKQETADILFRQADNFTMLTGCFSLRIRYEYGECSDFLAQDCVAQQAVAIAGISQSGESPDIVGVLAEGRRQGQPTVAITNAPHSPLAQAADFVVDIRAGVEAAVAATKSYTAQLLAIAMLSTAWQPERRQAQSEINTLREVGCFYTVQTQRPNSSTRLFRSLTFSS
jgi:hypothetical protein